MIPRHAFHHSDHFPGEFQERRKTKWRNEQPLDGYRDDMRPQRQPGQRPENPKSMPNATLNQYPVENSNVINDPNRASSGSANSANNTADQLAQSVGIENYKYRPLEEMNYNNSQFEYGGRKTNDYLPNPVRGNYKGREGFSNNFLLVQGIGMNPHNMQEPDMHHWVVNNIILQISDTEYPKRAQATQ